MKPVRKNNLADLAAEQMLAELRRGTWTGLLPGVRALSAWLRISPPTLARALRLLVERGVLEDMGPRRRYRISGIEPAQQQVAASDAPARRHLLILTHQTLSLTANATRDVIERIVADASAAGWTIGYEIIDFFNARRPRRSWDEMMAALRPDAIIGVFGRPVLADWAAARGHRMMFLGGVSESDRVPVYAMRLTELLRPALRKLIAAGHRRICMPLCERAQAFNDRLIKLMAAEFAEAGLPFAERINTPQTAYSGPEVTHRLVVQALERDRITGWIFIDWREYIAAQGIFHRCGVLIPEDASVIVLVGEAVTRWHHPPLCHFATPVEALTRQILHWLENPSDSPAGRSFPGEWIDGESVAPPRDAES